MATPSMQSTPDTIDRGRGDAVDLSVVVVSCNDLRWLDRCLRSVLDHAGATSLEVILVDNGADGAGAVIEATFPSVRVLVCDNHGFAHANNRAAAIARGRYVLFLNPDTEVVAGSFGELLDTLERRPTVGLAGVRQVSADGRLWPTIRYFPSISRALGDALGGERWPSRPRWAGERELDLSLYDREQECDWTSGSFMCARREALLSAGLLDERFFLYCEEPDLCVRIKRAGWSVRHLPQMTIVHHARVGGRPPRMEAQDVYARRQYASKHFTAPRRTGYLAAIAVGYALRAGVPSPASATRRRAARHALATLLGGSGPPFQAPPPTAIASGMDAVASTRA